MSHERIPCCRNNLHFSAVHTIVRVARKLLGAGAHGQVEGDVGDSEANVE